MDRVFIEATNGFNWGKFMVARFDREDWEYASEVEPDQRLLRACGWAPDLHLLIFDLQTGEGGIFRHGGFARADLDKHKVWVCPMFEPFLSWLYAQKMPQDLGTLPRIIELPDAPSSLHGYRRAGA